MRKLLSEVLLFDVVPYWPVRTTVAIHVAIGSTPQADVSDRFHLPSTRTLGLPEEFAHYDCGIFSGIGLLQFI